MHGQRHNHCLAAGLFIFIRIDIVETKQTRITQITVMKINVHSENGKPHVDYLIVVNLHNTVYYWIHST